MTSTENLLGPLDDDQREAVVADPTPLVVFAGAGSGKTRVLSTRVAYMIDQGWVPADELFVTAFTKAAADEMQERIEALDVNTEGLNVGTFHSLLFRFLNADRFNKGQRRLNVAKQAQVKIAVTGMLGKPSRDFPKALNVEADLAGVLGLIGQWKNALVHDYDQQIADTRDAAPFGTDMWAAAHVYPMYQEWLADQGLLDFDDMLLMSYDLLATDAAALRRAREQWTGFLIDEAQDTNIAQWGIIRLLADPAESPNLTIVGDVR